jgi:hypothetical protein
LGTKIIIARLQAVKYGIIHWKEKAPPQSGRAFEEYI